MIYRIRDLVGDEQVKAGMSYGPGQWWVRSVPLRFYAGYLGAAWAVLRGRAVAVYYPETGELEAALASTGGISVPDMRQGAEG